MRFSTFLLKNLLRRKVRSLLTLLGISIGVATTVALLGVADGFRRVTFESISARGVHLVVLERGVVDQLSSDMDEQVLESVRALPHVKIVTPSLADVAAFAADGTTINVLMQGWEPGNLLFDGLEIKAGRMLADGDDGKAIVGSILAEFLDKKVGETIDVLGEAFEVIGVYDSFAMPENAGLIVSLQEMQRVMMNQGRITGFGVVVDAPSDYVEEVKAAINALVLDNGKDARLAAQTVRDYTQEALHIRVSEAMAWLTSAIAIVVGTIGVLNTMIMSVVERIREISILRAIGWKKSRIVRMILGESMILSILGAVIGTLAAFGLVNWLTTVPMAKGIIEGRISWSVVGLGVMMAMLVGLIGGSYPAWRAANLPPVKGLRSE